jgi:hypothetical protein
LVKHGRFVIRPYHRVPIPFHASRLARSLK